jgi:hypothetical protein
MKTITQVATELGVKQWHIRHAGYISKPPLFSGRFVFGDADVAVLKSYFSRKEQHEQTTTVEDLLGN